MRTSEGVCSSCGPTTAYYARGMCSRCYQKDFKLKNPDRDRAYRQKDNIDRLDKRRAYDKQRSKLPHRIEARKRFYRDKYESVWAAKIKTTYGVTPEDYRRMLEAQGGVCAICRSTTPGRKRCRYFAIDHCHKTGAVRGLLCTTCNTAIGLLGDCPDMVASAETYLRKPRPNGDN